jgi:hypothetical protein
MATMSRRRTPGPICLPCEEDEHDCCHNRLWEAGCQCRHERWPELRCGARGKRAEDVRVYVCDSPRNRHRVNVRGQLVHEGRYWYIPDPGDRSNKWWGWATEPLTWTWKRTVAIPREFDPYDPDEPCLYDQANRHEDVA